VPSHLKKNTNMLLMFNLTCPMFFEHGEVGLSHRWLLLDFWIVTIRPGLNFCNNPLEEVLISDSNSFWHTSTHHFFFLSVSNQGTNVTLIQCMSKFSLIICWHIPYKGSNLLVFSEMGVAQSLLTVLRTFSTFSAVQPVEGWPKYSQSSAEIS
jgi:hypothetical protein